MNPDWPWLALFALAIPPGLGHLCHFVLPINVVSGLGFREEVMDRARTALFACFWASSALLLWGHFQAPWWTWSWPLRGYAILCVISGLVVWPLATLVQALRRVPDGIAHLAAVHELAGPDERDDLIGGGRRSWLLRLPGNESFRLRLREWDVAHPGTPRAAGRPADRADQRPSHGALFPPRLLRAGHRRLPGLGGRPDRPDRRCGRARRCDRLGRAACSRR